MVVVGLVSFGVNRFLAQSQQQVLAASIAVIERTERVAQDADFAASLAAQLAAAESGAQARTVAAALGQRLDQITEDMAAMRVFLRRPSGPEATGGSAALIRQMEDTVRQLIAANMALQHEAAHLADADARLATLISTEADLARLRITAGIWDLYALPAGHDPRPGLDRLADADFFAYERLAEMAEAVAALDRLLPRIATATDPKELAALETEFEAALALARDRVGFMLSKTAQSRAGDEVNQLAQGLAPNGIFASRLAAVAARTRLDGLFAQLDLALQQLITEARLGRDETRARMQLGVASAGWQATVLSLALAGFILLVLLIGALVWARTRRKVVFRLGHVAERMVAVAEGDFGPQMPISGQDEIGGLEQALNILRARAIEAADLRNRLEAAVLDRTADVVAEMQSANAARADAEAQSRAKTHFLARMSHEIRTPLNGLIGLLDLLAGDERDATRRARLEVALTSARDLQAMTEDILAFSVTEDGQDQAERDPFDPVALARGLGAHLEVLAANKGLRAEVEIDPALPPALLGAAPKIRQVMMNLLSNAVKYTAQGGVTLSVTAHPAPDGQHEIAFAVRDTGPGMTAEETRQAFDIYGRSRSARQNGVVGVGLGLAIVRQLTDAMGGALHVSTRPGQGSCFTLVLRLAEASLAEISTPQPMLQPGSGKRVLVVDDHPVNRLVARGYLERLGCSVTETETGQAALDVAGQSRFDALLIDLGLPDLDGEEVAQRIDRKGARVAILTADLVRDDAGTRSRFGVDRILNKPISPRALADFLFGSAQPASALPPLAQGIAAVLRDDMEVMGADQTAEIVLALLADLETAVPDLRAATDPVLRRKLAHRLKGAASNFGLSTFCALMQRVQEDDLSALSDLEAVAAEAMLALLAGAEEAGFGPQLSAAKQ